VNQTSPEPNGDEHAGATGEYMMSASIVLYNTEWVSGEHGSEITNGKALHT